jgi:hypothetical protein
MISIVIPTKLDFLLSLQTWKLCRNSEKCHSEPVGLLRVNYVRNLKMLILLIINISRVARNDKKENCDTVS